MGRCGAWMAAASCYRKLARRSFDEVDDVCGPVEMGSHRPKVCLASIAHMYVERVHV